MTDIKTLHHAMIVKDIDNIVSEYGLPFFLECLALWAKGEQTSDGGAGDEPKTPAQLRVYKAVQYSASTLKDAADETQEF